MNSELGQLREVLVTMGNDVSLLDKWYRTDFNSVPPVSILQPIDTYLVHFLNKRVPKLQVIENKQDLLKHAGNNRQKVLKFRSE